MKRTRLKRQSRKRKAVSAEYTAFVLGVKDRDGWRCRYCRTRSGPLDPNHTKKPRATYLMDASSVVTLCRKCHNRCTGPYKDGRLICTPLGDGRFAFEVKYAKDKFAARLDA